MALTDIPVELSSTPGITDSSNATAITIDSSENVAITGNLSATKLTSNNGVLELDDNGSHNGVINVPASLFINLDSDNGATGEDFVIAKDRTSTSGGTELFRVQEDGNVGIGDSSPTSYANSQKTLVVEDSGSPAIALSDTGQTRDWFIIAQGSGLDINYADGGGSSSASNVSNVINMDNSGHVTMPLQSAFMARGGGQSNLANSTHILFPNANEIIDRNADYNDSIFTAPVTGVYNLSVSVRLISVTADASYIIIRLVTSNRNYDWIWDPRPGDDTWDYVQATINVLADMDASDTAYVYYYQSGGTFNNDIGSGVGHFSGYLAA